MSQRPSVVFFQVTKNDEVACLLLSDVLLMNYPRSLVIKGIVDFCYFLAPISMTSASLCKEYRAQRSSRTRLWSR